MATQEGGNGLHHTNFPLLGHPQPKGLCPSALSFCPPLCWVGLEKLASNFVAFGFPHQGLGSLPPSLAAFCPWEPGTLVYVGFGMQKEALFYSLREKQVPVPCQGSAGAPLLLRGRGPVERGAVGRRQCCPACKAKSEGVGWARASSCSGQQLFISETPRVWPR